MTSFTISKKILQKIVNLCNQISPKRSEIEIFTNTKIKILPESLSLSVASGVIYYNTEIAIENLEMKKETEFLVRTETLASIISLMNDEKLKFEIDLDKNNLLIQGSRSKHSLKISTEDLDDFNLPEKDEEKCEVELTISAEKLLEANKFALISVGIPKNVYQPEFLSVCYSFVESDFFVVSTDRFRILKNKTETLNLKFGENVELPKNFLLLPKNLQILNSALETEEVKITLETNLAFFQFGQQTIICRYGDGKYPDYNKIIPQSFACNFVLNVKDCLDSLRQVYFFAKANIINKNIIIEVIPSEQTIQFATTTDEGNSSQSSTIISSYQGEGETWKQSFNADYLIEYISALSCDHFLWEANPGKPSILSPIDNKENQLYLVSGLK